MSRPPIAIVITSRSNKEQLTRCLEFVYAQQYSGPKQIVVVDNASTDNSVFLVTSRYPQVKVISNTVNVGIGAALNQGILASDAPYVATLHQDVEINDNWIDRMVTALESDAKIGSACSLIGFRRKQGTYMEVDSAGIGFRNGRPVRFGEAEDPSDRKFREVRKVFGVSGVAAMYKREMLEVIKLGSEFFDEDLFAGYEDYDLALRAFMHGFSAVYVPDCMVVHKRGVLWEKNQNARIERDLMAASNTTLILTKCLPMELFLKYKKIIRKDMQQRMFTLARQYGLGVAARAWFFYRSARKNMIRKQIAIFERLNINSKAIEWEVFGRS